MKNKILACIKDAMHEAERITTRPIGEWGHSQEFFYQVKLLECFKVSKSMAAMAEITYSNFADGSISFPITSNPNNGYCDLVVYSREYVVKNDRLSHSVLCGIEIKYSGGYNPSTMRADFDRLCDWVMASGAKGYYVHIYVQNQTPIIRNIDKFMTSNQCRVSIDHRNFDDQGNGVSVVEVARIT